MKVKSKKRIVITKERIEKFDEKIKNDDISCKVRKNRNPRKLN